jgi:cytochrome c peroxidase
MTRRRWQPVVLLTVCATGAGLFAFLAKGVAQSRPSASLPDEIAEVERQVDAIEKEAVAAIASLLPGSPRQLPALGKVLFFDKALSVNRNEACAFCHMPQTGF